VERQSKLVDPKTQVQCQPVSDDKMICTDCPYSFIVEGVSFQGIENVKFCQFRRQEQQTMFNPMTEVRNVSPASLLAENAKKVLTIVNRTRGVKISIHRKHLQCVLCGRRAKSQTVELHAQIQYSMLFPSSSW